MIATIALTLLAGVLSWTFLEYAIHGWLGHVGKGRHEFSREHLRHHADVRYFSPTSHKLMIAVPVVSVAAVLASLVAGPLIGVPYALGLGAMYALYEIVHRRSHTHAPRGPYSRWVRRNHMLHHFHSPNTNHGVTSPLWDVVFRTYKPIGVVRVPRKHAMDWLIDPATGDVDARYADDYVLVGRARTDGTAVA